MRQMYLDADEDNDIHKLSFYSPNEGYVAFKNWIGYTTDSGRTYKKKFITTSNVNYGSYTNVNVTFGFGIEGVKAFDKNTLIDMVIMEVYQLFYILSMAETLLSWYSIHSIIL